MHRLRVRFHIIRNARIENVGKSQSCMVSKLRIIWKQTVVAVPSHLLAPASSSLSLASTQISAATADGAGLNRESSTAQNECCSHATIAQPVRRELASHKMVKYGEINATAFTLDGSVGASRFEAAELLRKRTVSSKTDRTLAAPSSSHSVGRCHCVALV